MCFRKRRNEKEVECIRHYTNLKALWGILEKGFRFGTPRDDWDDLNDYFTLSHYEELTNSKVFVICFCAGLGNAHHWYYYGYNTGAMTYENCTDNIKCNIKLDRQKFENKLHLRGLKLKPVKYAITNEEASLNDRPTHNTLDQVLMCKEDLLYIKRSEYEVEKELRIIALKDKKKASEIEQSRPDNISDFIDCIESITLLLDEESVVYRLLEKKIVFMYPALKGKINNSGVHKSLRWKKEIQKIIRDRDL